MHVYMHKSSKNVCSSNDYCCFFVCHQLYARYLPDAVTPSIRLLTVKLQILNVLLLPTHWRHQSIRNVECFFNQRVCVDHPKNRGGQKAISPIWTTPGWPGRILDLGHLRLVIPHGPYLAGPTTDSSSRPCPDGLNRGGPDLGLLQPGYPPAISRHAHGPEPGFPRFWCTKYA